VYKWVAGGEQRVYVYDAAGDLAAEYSTAANGSPCATCYLVEDQLGSTRLVTSQTGAVVGYHDYLPFGEEVPAGYGGRNGQFRVSDLVTQKFTGKERDPETGLDYFGARYYGSALGRFTSPDDFKDSGITDPSTGKVIFSPGPLPYADLENPQSLNKYTYTLNNPLRYTDPDGHCPICFEAFTAFEESPIGQEITETVSENADKIVASGGALAGAVASGLQGSGNAYPSYYHGELDNGITLSKNQQAAQGPVKAKDAAGTSSSGQATDEHGNKLGGSGKPQVHETESNTREGAKNKALNEGSGAVEHTNPKVGKPHFHPADAESNKKPTSVHHNYPDN
jgi:RHS repeat-associated protein